MRKYVTKNQFYPHLLILCEAVMEWLQKLTFSQFCSIMGIDKSELVFVVLWELTGKLVFIMDSRFHGNDIMKKSYTYRKSHCGIIRYMY